VTGRALPDPVPNSWTVEAPVGFGFTGVDGFVV
jgi:hypothetical protein